MAVSSSLRRSLRKVPAFRALPARDLEAMTGRMMYRDYKCGEVIWRTRTANDFVAIIQHGEIVLEHRIYGSLVRSSSLSAGDLLAPRRLNGQNPHSILLARAATDVSLGILPMEPPAIRRVPIPAKRPGPGWRGQALWLALVLIFIIALSWNDLTRIASGLLYVAATEPSSQDEQQSMTLLEYAETVDEGAVYAYNREGYLWFQRDDLQQAEAAFMQALTVDQANGPALNNQAVTLFRTGQITQAEMYQQEASRSDPDNASVKYNLGMLFMESGDKPAALHAFQEASFIDPDWDLPHLQESFLYLEMGDNARAEEAARQAIKLNPAHQPAHFVLASALYNQGRSSEAVQPVEDAIRMNPDDRIARFYKARILIHLGEFERALAILEGLGKSAFDPQEIARIHAEIEALDRYLRSVPPGVR